MPSYVYELTDPRDDPEPKKGQVVYVGVTDTPYGRHKVHADSDGTIGERVRWIVLLRREGFAPSMRIRETWDTREKAVEREEHWIHEYQARSCIVLNIRSRDLSLDQLKLLDKDFPDIPVEEVWNLPDEEFLEYFGNRPLAQAFINWSHSDKNYIFGDPD